MNTSIFGIGCPVNIFQDLIGMRVTSYPDSIETIRDWYIDKLVWAKGSGLIYYRRRNGNEFHIDHKRLNPK